VGEGLRELQITREAAQRQAAVGKRAAVIQEGHLGPVLKRWINADVLPIATMLRVVAETYLSGDMLAVGRLLDSPTIELSQRERPLKPLMEWCLRGSSPGRAVKDETTYAEDLALAFMATLVTRLASADCSVSSGMTLAAEALRDTVQGQFITSIQGATAMQAIRQRKPELWQQKKSLQRIAMQLASQVKPQMLAEERGEIELEMRGHRKVLKVVDYKGDTRRLELSRVPDAVDWQIMSLCWSPEKDSSASPFRPVWLAFAGILLAISQKTGGWFEVTDGPKRHRKKGVPRMLVLSQPAQEAISRDVERWLRSGFVNEPMLVPPEDGDYLTVKHKKVTGQRPPKGLLTDPTESFAWREGVCALADTAWAVNAYALPDPLAIGLSLEDTMRTAEHRRLGDKPFYLPMNMDFRGRAYYRTTWVGPQSGDLGKSLLCFPSDNKWMDEAEYESWYKALVMHMSSLYGGPDKLDKAPFGKRWDWFQTADPSTFDNADKPLTLKAHWALMEAGLTDSIPVQLDGTCNGLQHLSALFRDEQAAPHVNLCASTDAEPPADIYGKVAETVLNTRLEPFCQWMSRLQMAGVKINRSLCKGPVMVLPYGGTREAVRLSVKAAVLEQLDCGDSTETPWHRYVGDGYEAFKDRTLGDHPLFNADIGHLSTLVWESISPSIPRAMAAMEALQEIAKWVGTRALSWATGPSTGRLWVVQAKSKAQQKRVTMKGFHLPDMVRRLTLMSQSNEVDPRAHRTGIVANFIHSLDAAHLARAVATFRARGGGSVGAVHDCLLVRPSQAGLMGTALRDSFVEMYEEDPLSQPVRLIETEGPEEGVVTDFDNWYGLAQAARVSLPSRGSFDIQEVKRSAWFFS